jgi:adenylosuccinate synthase
LCLTKLDVLAGLSEIQVCTGYRLHGRDMHYADLDAYGLDEVELVYEKLKGWDADITGLRSFDALPVEARQYIKFIEQACAAPVKWISVGPERQAMIRR